MDIAVFRVRQFRTAVERLAEEIEQSSETIGRDLHVQRRSEIVHRHAALETGGAVQSHGAHVILVEVLVDLEQIGFVIDGAA